MARRTSDPGVEECKGLSPPNDHTTSASSTPLPLGFWNLKTRVHNTGTATPRRLTRTEGQRLDDLSAKRARYAELREGQRLQTDALTRRASQQQQANADAVAESAALQAMLGETTRLAAVCTHLNGWISRMSKVDASDGGNVEGPTNTKARLNDILESFHAFDSDMKIGTRTRREKDEYRIAQLTSELTRLEKILKQEVKRRIEINKSVQKWGETEVEHMSERLQSMIQERGDAITSRLEAIVAKIDTLEEKFDVEMAKIPVDVKRRGEELTKMLLHFEGKFETERLSRLEREGLILKQLADHEQDVTDDFDTERTSRENTFADLRRILDENVRSRIKGDEKFQTLVREELAALKNTLSLERQTREKDDGEIVDALNRYTSKLQSSLKIINSSDI